MRRSNIFGMTLCLLFVFAVAETGSAQCSSGNGQLGGYGGQVNVQPAPAGVYTPALGAYPQITQYPPANPYSQVGQYPQANPYSQTTTYPQASQCSQTGQCPNPSVKNGYDSLDLFGNPGNVTENDNEQYDIYVTNPLNGEESLFKTVTGHSTARRVQSQLEQRFLVMYLDAGRQGYKEARSERDAETVVQELRASGYRVTNVAKVLVRIGNSDEDSLDGLFQSGGQERPYLDRLNLSQLSDQSTTSQDRSQTKPTDDTLQLLAGTWSAPGKFGADQLGVIQLKLLSNGYTTLTVRSTDGEESVHHGQASIEARRLKFRTENEEFDFGTIESMDQNSFVVDGPDGESKFVKQAS